MNIKEKVKSLPITPGVYLMKDSLDNIIYVGKAKNLKRRVQSYFQSSKSHSPKVEKLVRNLKNFDYILTDTEFEAFMLECKLIKEIKPAYNRLMKSPLSYTYLRIQRYGEYPIMLVANSIEDPDDFFYFGPYTSRSTVERALQGIKEIFKINCSNPSRKSTACLNYSLGSCIGMCLGDSAAQYYRNVISQVISMFNGEDNTMLETMETKMLQASEIFDFENAAKYRDYIDAVKALLNKKRVIEFTEENKNIVIVEGISETAIKLFFIKRNRIILSEKYIIATSETLDLTQIVAKKLERSFKEKSVITTDRLSKQEVDESQIIYSYLKSSNCNYAIITNEMLCSENNLVLNALIQELLQKAFHNFQ